MQKSGPKAGTQSTIIHHANGDVVQGKSARGAAFVYTWAVTEIQRYFLTDCYKRFFNV